MMKLISLLARWARTFWPQAAVPSLKERLAAAIGAAIALTATFQLSHLMLGEANPWFIAPMGASAVLLFGVPASPLAQPWSIIGGNLLASVIGVACAQWIGHSGLAGGIAVGLTIALMFSLRCLHPPSGAVALTAVFGGPAINHLGWAFAIVPVLVNSLLLTAVALVFNNALRRRYPHAAPVNAADKTPVRPAQRIGVSREDLHAVLAARGEYVDIDEGDLQAILSQAEQRAHRRHFGGLRCADFMTRELWTIEPDASCHEAGSLLRQHRIDVLPVVSKAGELLGIVTSRDLLADAERRPDDLATHPVSQVMCTAFPRCAPDDAVEQLVLPFTLQSMQCSLVIDPAGKLVGLVTASDVLAALYQEQLEKGRAA